MVQAQTSTDVRVAYRPERARAGRRLSCPGRERAFGHRVTEDPLLQVSTKRAPSVEDILDTSKIRRGGRAEQLVRKAYSEATRAHASQVRKDGSPYAEHVKRTTYNIAKLGGNAAQIAAALLHDTIEDCGGEYCYQYLRVEFGKAVAELVVLLTKPKWDGSRWIFADDADYALTKNRYNDELYDKRNEVYFNRLFTYDGIKALLIKLCDTFDNLTTMEHQTTQRRERNLGTIIKLLNVIARLDDQVYTEFVHELKRFGYNVPDYAVLALTGKAVFILPPRESLDGDMLRTALPVRVGRTSVISVYVDLERLHETGSLEIGLPREWNRTGLRRLETAFPDIRFKKRRSLLASGFRGAEIIYSVDSFSRRDTESTFDRLVARLVRMNAGGSIVLSSGMV